MQSPVVVARSYTSAALVVKGPACSFLPPSAGSLKGHSALSHSVSTSCAPNSAVRLPSLRRLSARAAGDGATMQQEESTPAGTEAGAGALAKEKCIPCHNKTLKPLPQEEAEALLAQEVPQWQLVEVEGAPRLRRTWKTKNFLAGLEFFKRISDIAEAEGHHPDLHLEGWNNARVEVFTHTIGGLHKNDFILAAKIEALDATDLMRKPKKSFV